MSDQMRRFPAEWESEGYVMIAWPHAATDWAYMLDDVEQCYIELAAAISKVAKLIVVAPDIEYVESKLSFIPAQKIVYFRCETNDTWTRDYGPLTLETTQGMRVLDFCFNGWGMKFAADKDNLVTSKMCEAKLICAPSENRRGFVLEGGGIESDGRGTLMTTAHCQLSPNRNAEMNEQQITDYLKDAFEATNVLWVRHGYLAGDDTDSHIDTLARFAPNDTIVYVGCQDPNDEHYDELQKMKLDLQEFRTQDGMAYNLVELPMPDAVYDEDGQRLPATYANFLVLPNAVIMPTYGQPQNDHLAYLMLKATYMREVLTVDCRALIRQHGSLHCATMQIPNEAISI